MSYQPAVYREQGGDKLIVASSGELEVQSGGIIDLQSGSSFAAASGAGFNIASGVTFTATLSSSASFIRLPKVARTTTNSTLGIPSNGHVVLTGSSTNPTFALEAPVAGGFVSIHCKSIGASGTAILTSTADITSGKNRLKFDAIDEACILQSSSTGWAVVSNVGSVASTSG